MKQVTHLLLLYSLLQLYSPFKSACALLFFRYTIEIRKAVEWACGNRQPPAAPLMGSAFVIQKAFVVQKLFDVTCTFLMRQPSGHALRSLTSLQMSQSYI